MPRKSQNGSSGKGRPNFIRLPHSILHDPDIQMLSLAEFRTYIGLLLIANQQTIPGHIPSSDKLAFLLRDDRVTVENHLETLTMRGLIGARPFQVLGWEKDYKPRHDSSKLRMRKFRAKRNNVTRHSDVTVTVRDGLYTSTGIEPGLASREGRLKLVYSGDDPNGSAPERDHTRSGDHSNGTEPEREQTRTGRRRAKDRTDDGTTGGAA